MNIRELLRNERIVPADLLNSIESSSIPLESIGIDAINLSRRSYNALRRNGIDTIYKLVHCSERDLFKIRNIVYVVSEIGTIEPSKIIDTLTAMPLLPGGSIILPSSF